MTGFLILIVAVVCLGVGFYMGRRSGIESEIRRQLREDRRD
ncbi:MAG: hypothetical protein WBA97_01760 [Actinophytocola sp.]